MTTSRGCKTTIVTLALAVGVVLGMALGRPAGTRADDAKKDPHAGSPRSPINWAPVDKMGLYLCAFHVAKENPKFEVEAHHYCSQQAGDLHQCVVFDSRGPNPKLLGVEYITTDESYQKFPAEEKKYWHPHAYEITSGQLIAPDMAKQGDDAFPAFIKTWGKTFHTWRDPASQYPFGEPLLMWSANGDGQVSEGLISKRDAAFGISTKDIRERRKAMGFAVPNIPPPKSVSDIGRTWTASGKDEPTMLPKTNGK